VRVIGLMSGTSVDAIDVAAADLDPNDDVLELTPLGYVEHRYPERLRESVRAALPPGLSTSEQLCRLDTRLGQIFAEAAGRGVQELAGGQADLVVSLGQTIYHWVEGGQCLGTLQLGQPAWIAEATGVPVVSDLRARDVAAGGHGAPLASTLDALWLRDLAMDSGRPAAALNIGGIANVTVVHGDNSAVASTVAYDTGPGNALLDAATLLVTDGARDHDTDGALARQGTVRADLLERLLSDPYYAVTAPKSTGKEHFNAEYLQQQLDGLPSIDPADLLRTLVELTASTIARDIRAHGADTVLASGGGMHNPVLAETLATRLGEVALRRSDELGLPTAAKEAYLAALLGWLTWHGIPGNLPSATGARQPRVLGSITPGSAGAPPAAAVATQPTRLRVLIPDTPTPGHSR